MSVIEFQPLYTVGETAKLLKTNTNFVYDEIRAGRLPALNLGCKKVRGSDLEQYIMRQEPVAAEDQKGGLAGNGRI